MPSTPPKYITMDTPGNWSCSSSFSDGSYAEDDYDDKSYSDNDSFEDDNGYFDPSEDFGFSFDDDNDPYAAPAPSRFIEAPFWFGNEESGMYLGFFQIFLS